jgi:hypothetical protein
VPSPKLGGRCHAISHGAGSGLKDAAGDTLLRFTAFRQGFYVEIKDE